MKWRRLIAKYNFNLEVQKPSQNQHFFWTKQGNTPSIVLIMYYTHITFFNKESTPRILKLSAYIRPLALLLAVAHTTRTHTRIKEGTLFQLQEKSPLILPSLVVSFQLYMLLMIDHGNFC